ncbi:NADH:ubiquinone oxidoreductase subunit NDUFA12 [Sphingomicrobium astaxanthinifaciens]|uniref:NADH:ubiquinone oxidoreductase subunit NDUFA12 n=1 Tax=Sphingomicrobium astaxanthinifaciens TaxID=1227949 RepID=UPI001FCB8284|nr:NADH:ubiquinone oxidoreductase subunit NDUFA12 [Sphingomicrobium astaxanthinifaciens]MCJ7421796.1 NADH:ubiquinone oxidoreductase subunit NDUFA12 [Sphingomicrobium astaxanthinifaciens]
MGLLGKIFTWWNGASVGTDLFTRRHGQAVGTDHLGNVYYRHKRDPRRRWVIYEGSNDSSRVPPGWNAWLRGTIDEVPEQALPPRRPFEKDPSPNLTGTVGAYRPSGTLGRPGTRPAATGDYEAWSPEQD